MGYKIGAQPEGRTRVLPVFAAKQRSDAPRSPVIWADSMTNRTPSYPTTKIILATPLLVLLALVGAPSVEAAGPLTLTDAKDAVELATSLLTGVAIVVGGIWTYFNFIQGRIYYPKLEADVELALTSNDHDYYLRATAKAKNVGLSRINVIRDSTFIVVTEYSTMESVDALYQVDHDDGIPFSIYRDHAWIEPNELVRDECLVVIPKAKQVAVGASLRIVGQKYGWLGSRRRFEWNATRVLLVGTGKSEVSTAKGEEE